MQKEFFGFNTIFKLKNIIDELNAKKILLVTGRESFKSSGAKKKIDTIIEEYPRFFDFSKNPSIDEVKQGIIFYKEIKPDIVVGVGGGSVLDMAKSVNILAAQKAESELYITGRKKLEYPGKPLIAIPTTAGTGSEATYFATIYVDKTKYSLGDRTLTLPAVSIVDPSLTESAPRYLTASTGLDALCQGIESMWSVGSTDGSRKYASDAIEIAINTIEKVVNAPNRKSRLDMAKASHLSGKAINISKTTACHSVSYPITSYFRIPHGHAVALTMPQFLEFNAQVNKKDCNDKRGIDFVKRQVNEIIRLMNCKDAVDAKEKFRDIMKKIGIEARLSKLKIDQKGVELIIENGFTPTRMNNNPRKVTKEDLKNILEEIL